MIKMTYRIKMAEYAKEEEWLRNQKIYPSHNHSIDFDTGEIFTQIGVIVSPEAALAIKLKHKLDIQIEYRRK